MSRLHLVTSKWLRGSARNLESKCQSFGRTGTSDRGAGLGRSPNFGAHTGKADALIRVTSDGTKLPAHFVLRYRISREERALCRGLVVIHIAPSSPGVGSPTARRVVSFVVPTWPIASCAPPDCDDALSRTAINTPPPLSVQSLTISITSQRRSLEDNQELIILFHLLNRSPAIILVTTRDFDTLSHFNKIACGYRLPLHHIPRTCLDTFATLQMAGSNTAASSATPKSNCG